MILTKRMAIFTLIPVELGLILIANTRVEDVKLYYHVLFDNDYVARIEISTSATQVSVKITKGYVVDNTFSS